MSGKNIVALALLKDAVKAGFELLIWEDGKLYRGDNPTKAWNAVKSVIAAKVYLLKPGEDGKHHGWAYLMKPGSGTCAPDESIVNYTTGGWIDEWWEKNVSPNL